ncbi:MAG: Gfo/Idh/MocA family oxidoreductase [Anaerolineae bacterium]|nr:Gfo/Idh/MocA family oxidoreductase [Anaerolineae bacterium]
MPPLRIGILGCGNFSKFHVANLLNMRDVVIAALADPRPEGIANLRALYPALADTPAFDTLDAMLDGVAVDGVEIFTPHTLHAVHILGCLSRGVHVLVEKPMVTTPEAGEQVVAQAEATDRVVLVSYQRHYQPAYLYIKSAIQRGAIGDITMVSAVQGQNWRKNTVGTWRQDESLSGGGMLMDTGSHLVDVITWLVDQPVAWVNGYIDNDGAPVDVNSTLTISFGAGTVASLTVVGNMPYVSTSVFEDVTISGTQGALLYRNGRVYTLGSEGFTEPVILPPGSTPDRNWVDAILGRAPNASPPVVGLRVAQLTAAARQSSRLNQTVTV